MLDFTKPVQTRDGRKARIIATDRAHPTYPVVALVEDGGKEVILTCTEEGRYYRDAVTRDLVNVPERVVRYWGVSPGWGSDNPAHAPGLVPNATLLKVTFEDGRLVSAEPYQA